jgi:hypothetical protein
MLVFAWNCIFRNDVRFAFALIGVAALSRSDWKMTGRLRALVSIVGERKGRRTLNFQICVAPHSCENDNPADSSAFRVYIRIGATARWRRIHAAPRNRLPLHILLHMLGRVFRGDALWSADDRSR